MNHRITPRRRRFYIGALLIVALLVLLTAVVIAIAGPGAVFTATGHILFDLI